MPTNVIPGGEAFSFRGRDLHGALQQLTGQEAQDLAKHRPLKRNGTIIERMGWGGRVFTASLMFAGATFRAQATAVRQHLREGSRGLLVHPVYGQLQAVVESINDDLNIVQAANALSMRVVFVEDELDAKAEASRAAGVPEKAQALTTAATDFATSAALYTSAVTPAAALEESAAAYAAAALVVVQENAPDPSLGTKLAQIETDVAAAIAAVRADGEATSDADAFDAIAGAELVYAAALELADALRDARPPMIRHTVRAPTTLFAIAQRFYGADALTRFEEVLANNPHLTTPHLVPAGVELALASATV